MAFQIDQFSQARPYLFHLTARDNLPRIRRTKVLFPAATLLNDAGLRPVVNSKRTSTLSINIDGESILIRDQHPLHRGNIKLLDKMSFEDFIALLNQHVFFWPGTESGPISYGMRHFARYQKERPVILRTSFDELVSENQQSKPFFCKYNSGAPRCSGGQGSPRGKNTFVPSDAAEFNSAGVVEVTFNSYVNLPPTTIAASSPGGPWRPLFKF